MSQRGAAGAGAASDAAKPAAQEKPAGVVRRLPSPQASLKWVAMVALLGTITLALSVAMCPRIGDGGELDPLVRVCECNQWQWWSRVASLLGMRASCCCRSARRRLSEAPEIEAEVQDNGAMMVLDQWRWKPLHEGHPSLKPSFPDHACYQPPGVLPLANVTLLTLRTAELPPQFKTKLLKNRLSYAWKHGYRYCEFRGLIDPWRHAKWSKVLAVMSVLPSTQLVVHLDADAIITNHSVSITDIWREHNPQGRDVLYSRDYSQFGWFSLNSGVYIMASTQWSFLYLLRLYNVFVELDTRPQMREAMRKIPSDWVDQRAMANFIFNSKEEFEAHTTMVDSKVFNQWSESLPKDAASSDQPAPFIVHYASVEDKYKLLGEKLGAPDFFGGELEVWPPPILQKNSSECSRDAKLVEDSTCLRHCWLEHRARVDGMHHHHLQHLSQQLPQQQPHADSPRLHCVTGGVSGCVNVIRSFSTPCARDGPLQCNSKLVEKGQPHSMAKVSWNADALSILGSSAGNATWELPGVGMTRMAKGTESVEGRGGLSCGVLLLTVDPPKGPVTNGKGEDWEEDFNQPWKTGKIYLKSPNAL